MPSVEHRVLDVVGQLGQASIEPRRLSDRVNQLGDSQAEIGFVWRGVGWGRGVGGRVWLARERSGP